MENSFPDSIRISFEWLVMPEGLTNAPAAFQQFMNNIFADMIDINDIVYLDNILVYSDNLMEHKQHVWEVLRRLRTNGLFAYGDKCEFHVTSCEYLRYMLSPDGLMMAQNKVQIIQDWPELHKVKDIQSFLGFTNFYHCFIYEYSRIVILLMNLTRKNVPWNFTDECRSAFNTLKKAFTTAPVLTHWIPDTQIIVETDASAMCSQPFCPLRPLLESYTPLCSTPRHSHLRNATAMSMIKSYSQSLKPSPIGDTISRVPVHQSMLLPTIRTFSTFPLPKSSSRWSEFLSTFNLIICFHPRKLGTKPDTLTRQWDVYPKEGNSNYATVNPQNY